MRSALALVVVVYVVGCELAIVAFGIRWNFLNDPPKPVIESFDDLVQYVGGWVIEFAVRVFGWPYFVVRVVPRLGRQIVRRSAHRRESNPTTGGKPDA